MRGGKNKKYGRQITEIGSKTELAKAGQVEQRSTKETASRSRQIIGAKEKVGSLLNLLPG